MLIFLLALIAVSVVICYSIAKKRGAKVSYWVVMGAAFGPFAIPFVFFAKPRDESRSISPPHE